MPIREAEARLRKVTDPKAWMRRVNIGGMYVYNAGIGDRGLAINCAFPDHCENLAHFAFDHQPTFPVDGLRPGLGLVTY